MVPSHFTGYAALNEEQGKRLDVKPFRYAPKKWSEDDVTIKITHCGICGSCVHTLTNGWPYPTKYPAVCGHEVVGIVVEAGSNTTHKVGDRVGVGAQSSCCGSCAACKQSLPQYCRRFGGTYQGTFEDGTLAQGGFADYIRTKGAFAVSIPDGISSENVAPLLCAGVTTYSPLKRWRAGPGKKVGVIGIGGLGHLGLQFAKAMGADTYALSSSNSKIDDVIKMGISKENYISYSDQKSTIRAHRDSFDLLLCTASSPVLPLDSLFLKLLSPTGAFVILALPEEKLPAIWAQAFCAKGVSLAGSSVGSPKDIEEMLKFAVKTEIKPWIQVRPMEQLSQALKDVHAGKPRYRYVMFNPPSAKL